MIGGEGRGESGKDKDRRRDEKVEKEEINAYTISVG
jgi:hypothetical protein